MCACRCGIQVTLENDELRFIQGTRDHPVNQGVLCAKGSAGIMKQHSPAKLAQAVAAQGRLAARPRRVRGNRMGRGARHRRQRGCAQIRTTDPRKLAFFTGRDQMQALSGLWAQQFGTPNWAAHGGFCSVNMAAAGLYTIGYLVLGIRRARLGSCEVLRAVGRGRGSFVESDQDRPRQAEAPRREVRLDQSDPHRLLGDRRRVGADPAGHRRTARARDRPRAADATARSTTNSSRATRTRRGSSSTRPERPGTACLRGTRTAGRWCSTRRAASSTSDIGADDRAGAVRDADARRRPLRRHGAVARGGTLHR